MMNRRRRRDPIAVTAALRSDAEELLSRAAAMSVRTTPQSAIARAYGDAADAREVWADALIESGREIEGAQISVQARNLRRRAAEIRAANFFVTKTFETWDEDGGAPTDKGVRFTDSPMSLGMLVGLFDNIALVPSTLPATRSGIMGGQIWFDEQYGAYDEDGTLTNYAYFVTGSPRAMRRLVNVLAARYPEWFQ